MQHFHSLACDTRDCVNGKSHIIGRLWQNTFVLHVYCLDEAAKATCGSVTVQAILWLMHRLEVKGSNA